MRIDYERQLNPAQYAAVTAPDGPVLIVAGAGSGKTRTLIYRVAWLVDQGVDPSTILLLTFTRRAADEMLSRAAAILDDRCRQVRGGTFHSVANHILHRYCGRFSYSADFTILDRGDAEDVVSFLMGKMDLRDRSLRFPKKRTVVDIFSKAVNRDQSLEELLERDYGQFLHHRDRLTALQNAYETYKRQNQVMDFDDLLVYLRKLLREHPDVCQELSRQYLYILVDEYQDTNRLQADIVKDLARVHGNIMVVGDDSQAIYAFRGADYGNILEFPRVYPGARIYKLEQNYRSSQPILDVANTVIQWAKEKYTKCLFTVRQEGVDPVLARPLDEGAQSTYVCEKIVQLQQRGVPLRQMAVLFRASYHSFDLEVELGRLGIPFVKYGGFKFIESAHVKDLLAHLKVLINPLDSMSWTRLLQLVDQVGAKRSQEILAAMGRADSSWDALADFARRLPAHHGLHRLVDLYRQLNQPGLTVSQQVRLVRDYYQPMLVARYDNYPKRLQELDYLQDWTTKYQRLSDFLADVTLEPLTAAVLENSPEQSEDRLVLSTIHSAKGLEWQAVFVISVVEGRLPPYQAYSDERALEEERRLLYVAVTRAKDHLCLCAPQQVYDRATGKRIARLSPFLNHLPASVRLETAPGSESRLESWRGESLADGNEFAPGDAVRHPYFGRGRVLASLERSKVRVRFEDGRTRLLHLQYAPLQRLLPQPGD
ncbi:MAG: ATP-dependent helicase [Deltaproteobacteria bacterium]|nr:ATP-dependent helicase [Deltaproteobacteria bacterium]MBW2069967.1 ATP-dependent helicase [Deltaproteobacteria bacterium]